jgi:hypothetical protein
MRLVNPGGFSELFVQVERGLYRLAPFTPYASPEPAIFEPVVAGPEAEAEFQELDHYTKTPDEDVSYQFLKLRKKRAEELAAIARSKS